MAASPTPRQFGAPPITHQYVPLPSTEKRGWWIHLDYPVTEGWRILRTLKDWLRPHGYRLKWYGGTGAAAIIWHHRGREREPVGVVCGTGRYDIWLTDSEHVPAFVDVMRQLEVA